MFKRRTKRSLLGSLSDALYPRGGWKRAFSYVMHRIRRLPDTPETIARGIFAGVFTTFTPFYGLHFFIAIFLAKVMRGNILAALLATFFGNPLTYVPIGIVSLKVGHFLLGSTFDEGSHRSLGGKFLDAGEDLKNNFLAIFTDRVADWENLSRFYHEVFLPYLVGGVIPGIITALIAYYLSVPIIRVYQKRRKGRIKAKLAELRKKASKKADSAGDA
ncbi:DUF2062 domain-containing protein [Pseudogemmobacter sp. W21_MBD1_M6]|uniref:DUF2062 domain-containing protein n=1 Tax=Pseudogemmobacter sp. W21_MBD1_M6 TaxID=3240271 RepID=UPI003F983FC8